EQVPAVHLPLEACARRPSTVRISVSRRYYQPMRVRELAEWLGATYEGDGEKELLGAAPLETAGASELAFIGGKKAAAHADLSAAGCLLVQPEWPNPSYRTVIRAPEPRTAFARAMSRF